METNNHLPQELSTNKRKKLKVEEGLRKGGAEN